jgi:5'-3' exonuclease
MTTKWDAHDHVQLPQDKLSNDRYFDETLTQAQNEQINALNEVDGHKGKKGQAKAGMLTDFDQFQDTLLDANALTPTARDVPLESIYGHNDGFTPTTSFSTPASTTSKTTHYIPATETAPATKTTLPSTQAPTQPPVGTISVHAHDIPILPSLWYSSSQYHNASDRYIGPTRGWWNKFESLDTSQGGVESVNINDVWGYGFYSKKNNTVAGSDLNNSPLSATSASTPKKATKKKIKLGSEFDYSLAAMTDGTTSATSCASENAFDYDDEAGPPRGDEYESRVEGGSLMNALLPEGINVTRGKHANQTNIDGQIMDVDDALAKASDGELQGEVGAQGKELLDHEINNLFIEGMKSTYTPYYGVHINPQTPQGLVEEYLEKKGSLPSLLNQYQHQNGKNGQSLGSKQLFNVANHSPTPITPTPPGFKLEQPDSVSDYDRALFKYLTAAKHLGSGSGQDGNNDQIQEQKEYDILTSTLPPHLTSWLPHIDQVFVVSGDKDVEQVISPHVTLIKHNGSAGLKYAMTKYKKKGKGAADKKELKIAPQDFFVDGSLDEYPFAAVSVSQHTHNDPLSALRPETTMSLDGDDHNQNQVEVASQFDWIATPAKPAFGSAQPLNSAIYDLSEQGSSFPIDNEGEIGGEDKIKGKKAGNKVDDNKPPSKESLLGPHTASSHNSLYNTDRSKWKMHVNPTSAHAYHTGGDGNSLGSDDQTQSDAMDWQNGTSYTIQNYPSSLQKYGFCPSQLPQLQALMGDPSDNIPGIKGIGPTMASKLISQFGDINNVVQIASLFLGYDSTQTQVLIDRTFSRTQYQKANRIEATLGDNEMNILFSPLDCRGYQPIPSLAGSKTSPAVSVNADGSINVDTNPEYGSPDQQQSSSRHHHNGLDTLSIPTNHKTMKRLSKRQALLDMAQRQQMALSLDWPLSTRLTQQLLNNLDALFISLSLVTMRQDLKIPSPKHTLYIGSDKKHVSKVFNQYNMFAMSDEMRNLFDSHEKSVLKGAYNGEYGELLLDAGLYLHQIRQGMGISPNDANTGQNEGKEGFLSYSDSLPHLPSARHFRAGSRTNQYGSNTTHDDDSGYYQLHFNRAKQQIGMGKGNKKGDKGQNDIVLTDYNTRPKYAFDPNLLKIADNQFYRPTYATYGMGSVDGKYHTSFDPYGGVINVHQKIFPNRKNPENQRYYKIQSGGAAPPTMDLGLADKMEKEYVSKANYDLTRYIKDKCGNTVLFMPYDIHHSFVFNLDENHADHVRGMAQQQQQQPQQGVRVGTGGDQQQINDQNDHNDTTNTNTTTPAATTSSLQSVSHAFQSTPTSRSFTSGSRIFAKAFGMDLGQSTESGSSTTKTPTSHQHHNHNHHHHYHHQQQRHHPTLFKPDLTPLPPEVLPMRKPTKDYSLVTIHPHSTSQSSLLFLAQSLAPLKARPDLHLYPPYTISKTISPHSNIPNKSRQTALSSHLAQTHHASLSTKPYSIFLAANIPSGHRLTNIRMTHISKTFTHLAGIHAQYQQQQQQQVQQQRQQLQDYDGDRNGNVLDVGGDEELIPPPHQHHHHIRHPVGGNDDSDDEDNPFGHHQPHPQLINNYTPWTQRQLEEYSSYLNLLQSVDHTVSFSLEIWINALCCVLLHPHQPDSQL